MPSLTRLELIASQQHWVLTLADLNAAGFTKSAVRHAVDARRIFRRYPGIYVFGRSALTERGEFLAAVLACGDGALLSHLSAARLWGIWEAPVRRVAVSIGAQDGRTGPPGLRLHRSRTLCGTDSDLRDGIPVTTLRRTLLDVAGILSPRDLRSTLRRAQQDHRLDLPELHRYAAEPRTVAKHARLCRALEEWVPKADLTESDLELEFFDFCRRHRLPIPEPQQWFGRRHRPDFVFEEFKLIVETDSWRYHSGSIQQQADGAKDRAMKARGYEVQRFTWAEIINQPRMVARELRAAFERRSAELGSL